VTGNEFGQQPERGRAWFEALYRDHHAAILSYARRRVDEPEDLVAEVFGTAWRVRNRVPEKALPWLIRTARNHSMHAVRASSRRARLQTRVDAVVAASADDHADDVVNRQDAAVAIMRAMAKLLPGDQEVLRLAEWERLDTHTIAYVLECSDIAARTRLHRARRRLEAALERDAPPVGISPDDRPQRTAAKPVSTHEVMS
jgi:RNA polymerase sigma-70 factor (ECF subfamily)